MSKSNGQKPCPHAARSQARPGLKKVTKWNECVYWTEGQGGLPEEAACRGCFSAPCANMGPYKASPAKSPSHGITSWLSLYDKSPTRDTSQVHQSHSLTQKCCPEHSSSQPCLVLPPSLLAVTRPTAHTPHRLQKAALPPLEWPLSDDLKSQGRMKHIQEDILGAGMGWAVRDKTHGNMPKRWLRWC